MLHAVVLPALKLVTDFWMCQAEFGLTIRNSSPRVNFLAPGHDCCILYAVEMIQDDRYADSFVYLDRPRKISGEFDGEITHTMLVSTDPLEQGVSEWPTK
jgi:hypothetical protein